MRSSRETSQGVEKLCYRHQDFSFVGRAPARRRHVGRAWATCRQTPSSGRRFERTDLRQRSELYTLVTLHAKRMREDARVNVRVNEAALGGFFAHAMRVCACACFTFFPPFFFLPFPLPTMTEPVSKKAKGKKLLMCACFKSSKRGWCCALVCLIGQITIICEIKRGCMC